MYSVDVIGLTWGGFTGTYTYKVPELPADKAAVKHIAGDFSDIVDYRITQQTHEHKVIENGYQDTITHTEVRSFQDSDSEDFWCDCNMEF